ncbi:hypothetical protein GCM10022223_47860 [Kineosporia mesophila]|uniref:Uncharacterized protein n=1 Tax=Kineosporia mesophila TaxID=566012 RepID=A0ABP7A5B3_9ACTN
MEDHGQPARGTPAPALTAALPSGDEFENAAVSDDAEPVVTAHAQRSIHGLFSGTHRYRAGRVTTRPAPSGSPARPR